jgi:hypothetical protein
MSVENLTSVVTDPYHVTDPEHGFTAHDPETVAFAFAPAFPIIAPGSAGPRTPEPGPAARPGPGLPQRHSY